MSHHPYREPNQETDDPRRIVGWAGAALLVILLIVGLNIVLFHPKVNSRVDYALLRVQSLLKKLRPHAQYLPTPVQQAMSTTLPYPPPAQPTPTRSALTATAPAAVATPTQTPTPLPPAVVLKTGCHEPQGWNNCGPATLSMALCFHGWTEDQYAVAANTKPDRDDRNVSPEEMVAFVQTIEDMDARMGCATDSDLLRGILSAGFPVIVETWFIPEPGDEMGHYRLLTGYDDAARQFIVQDSYLGPDQQVPYDELETRWRVFNRVYVVVFRAAHASALDTLLGDLDAEAMYGRALAVSLAEAEAAPQDKYAWFNVGTNYTRLGRYEEAAQAYDRARILQLPWRMLWYQFDPFEAYLRAERYDEVIALADANLRLTPNLEESLYYRALARRALGDTAGAESDLKQALSFNPLFVPARRALGE